MSMRIFQSLDEVPAGFGPSVVTIGNFDGVHRGHQWILDLIHERARESGAKSVAVTFEPHPMRVLRAASGPLLLTPLAGRLALLESTGVDAVLVLAFTEALSCMTGAEFVTAILRDALHAVEVHEGENFRFGHRAHCGTADLELLGEQLGFAVRIHAPRHVRGLAVSSSKVRECILAGDMATARALLGRPFAVRSTPASGRGVGSRLTVPTINLAEYDELLPADGVYISCMAVGEGEGRRAFAAVTNAGKRPTFGADSYAVETYLLDYDPENAPLDLGPETPLELTFLKRLREEQRFPSPEALKAQIFCDVGVAKR